MVFGLKAYDNILPWLHMKFSQKILIQNMFLSHPQNIQWRYTLEHARNYIETFRGIMNLLGVDIPPLEGVVQLHFLMTKKRTLEMMECVKEFVDSEVLEAVHQRTDKVKIARTAKVEERMMVMEVLKEMKEMQAAAAAVAVAVAAAAAAAAKRKEIMEAEAARTCVRLCKDVGCCRLAFSNGVCRGHGPRCSHVGCDNDVYAKNVCIDHGPRCRHVGCDNNPHTRGVCRGHGKTNK